MIDQFDKEKFDCMIDERCAISRAERLAQFDTLWAKVDAARSEYVAPIFSPDVPKARPVTVAVREMLKHLLPTLPANSPDNATRRSKRVASPAVSPTRGVAGRKSPRRPAKRPASRPTVRQDKQGRARKG